MADKRRKTQADPKSPGPSLAPRDSQIAAPGRDQNEAARQCAWRLWRASSWTPPVPSTEIRTLLGYWPVASFNTRPVTAAGRPGLGNECT